MNVVTRFAPSPTGLFHAGSYRTAVFSYLYARHQGGRFILRIEDTDRARSTKENEKNILDTLEWLGLEYDEFHRQSEWVGEHEKILRDFVSRGIASVTQETGMDGTKREIIRFKNPNRRITFTDMIRGEISFDTTELGDFVIAKGFDEPLFHLVVVADDARQGVTHVIRGEDHISNTARQILIQEALGADRFAYAHLPLVLASDRTKLSKRKGAHPLLEYRGLGYLPEAVLNYVALLGWHPADDQEVLTKTELIERFTLEAVQRSGAIFDETKLKWFNREHILRLSPEAFLEYAETFLAPETIAALGGKGLLPHLVPLMRERIQTFGELKEMDANGEFSFYAEAPSYEPSGLIPKKDEPSTTKAHLERILELVQTLAADDWHDKAVKDAVWPYAEEKGRGSVLWPFRYALSGRDRSPDPFAIAGIIGKDETEKRIETALNLLS